MMLTRQADVISDEIIVAAGTDAEASDGVAILRLPFLSAFDLEPGISVGARSRAQGLWRADVRLNAGQLAEHRISTSHGARQSPFALARIAKTFEVYGFG